MANIIEALNRPTIVIAHNKTLAARLRKFKKYFPDNAVEYLLVIMITISQKPMWLQVTPILRRIQQLMMR